MYERIIDQFLYIIEGVIEGSLQTFRAEKINNDVNIRNHACIQLSETRISAYLLNLKYRASHSNTNKGFPGNFNAKFYKMN